jgi:hypothetical protein
MARLRRSLRSIALALIVAACGGEDPTEPDPSGNFIRARINGAVWTGDPAGLVTAAVHGGPGIYTITGVQLGAAGYTVILQLYNIGRTGTYPLGVTAQVFGGVGVVSQVGSSGWGTPVSGAAGTITFTRLDDARVAGTFAFTANALSGPGSVSVTDGEFDLAIFRPNPVGPLPENAGSRLSGTIGGQAFNAGAAIASVTAFDGPVLTIGGSNTERNIGISIANMTGPGTYALSGATPVRSIQVSGLPGNPLATWNSQTSGGSGSVTITSVTAARIQGTFTATLAAAGGGATGTLAVSGTFDMGRL